AAWVSTLPFQSIQVSSRNPIESITSVSPDHFPDEYPCSEGFGSWGNGRASVYTSRYPAFISLSTATRLGVWMNLSKCGIPYARIKLSGQHRICGSSFARLLVRSLTMGTSQG